MLFEARRCDMFLLHYGPIQLLVSINPFYDSCQAKTRLKILVEKPYIGELHAVPMKLKHELLSFHYR